MANLLVKEISAELLREVNYAASGEGLTQREWVIQELGKATKFSVAGKSPEQGSGRTGSRGHSKPQNSARRTAESVDQKQRRVAQAEVRVQEPTPTKRAKRLTFDGLLAKPGEPVDNKNINPLSNIGQPCPRCGKPLKSWGNGLRCEECKRNFTKGAA